MKKTLKIKAIAAGVALSMLLPYGAALADPSAAFNHLMGQASMSESQPGYFSSQAQHVYSGGSFDFHVPAESTQLVSVTPPTMSAGCGGIDLNLGGFNIVSGANFSAFIQAAAQAAPGYVIMLGIKTLCPQCAAVLSELHQLAEQAARSSMNSCQAGQWAASQALSLMGDDASSADGTQQACGTAATAGSLADNPLDAIAGGACTSLSSVAQTLGQTFAQSSPAQQASNPVFGNYGWIALTSLGMSSPGEMEFILSLTGTVSHTYSSTAVQQGSGGSTGGITTTYYPPTMSVSGKNAKQAMSLLMCGTTGSTSPDSVVAQYCAKELPAASVPTPWVCTDQPPALDPSGCQFMTFGQTAASMMASGSDQPIGATGFLLYVHSLLSNAVQAVISNGTLDPEFIALANVSPIPIYKIINIAAVYPAVSQQLVDNSSLVIAELLAEAYMQQIINFGARTITSTSATVSIAPMALPNNATAAFDTSSSGAVTNPVNTATGNLGFNYTALTTGATQSPVVLSPTPGWINTDTGGTAGSTEQPGVGTLTDTGGNTVSNPNSDSTGPTSGSFLNSAGSAGNGSVSDGAAVNQKLAHQMQDMLQALAQSASDNMKSIVTLETLQEQLLAQIRDIDQTIQAQAMHQGLIGNNWASVRILTPSVSNAAAPAPVSAAGVNQTSGINTAY